MSDFFDGFCKFMLSPLFKTSRYATEKKLSVSKKTLCTPLLPRVIYLLFLEKLSRGLTTKLSPSEEWQLKKGLKAKSHLTRAASNVIKSGWKIRHELHKIKR